MFLRIKQRSGVYCSHKVGNSNTFPVRVDETYYYNLDLIREIRPESVNLNHLDAQGRNNEIWIMLDDKPCIKFIRENPEGDGTISFTLIFDNVDGHEYDRVISCIGSSND
jgi:hypothetical protein